MQILQTALKVKTLFRLQKTCKAVLQKFYIKISPNELKANLQMQKTTKKTLKRHHKQTTISIKIKCKILFYIKMKPNLNWIYKN